MYLKSDSDSHIIPDFFIFVYEFLWVGTSISKCCTVSRADSTKFSDASHAITKSVSLHQSQLIPLVLQSGDIVYN